MSPAGHRHGESCRELVESLSEYLDGELPSGLCESIDSHMEDCPPCRAFLDSLRRTILWIGASGSEALPADVRQDLVRRAGAVLRQD